MSANFRKVFIHELGHFVSNWILYELIHQYKLHSIEIGKSSETSYWGKVMRQNRTDIKPARVLL